MKKIISICSVVLILIVGFSDETYSRQLNCDSIYSSCIDNNPYDIETQQMYYLGYVGGCTTSYEFCEQIGEST